MPTVKLPIHGKLHTNVNERTLKGDFMSAMFDVYTNELGNIVRRPGLLELLDLSDYSGTNNAVDHLYYWEGQSKALAVCGGSLFAITYDTPTASKLTGDVLTSGNRVVTCTAFDDGAIISADGGRMLRWAGGSSASFIADGDAPTTVSHVATIDTYLVCNEVGSGYWWASDVGDETAWTATSKAQAELASDDVLALHVLNSEVILVGSSTIEWWYDAASATFPFAFRESLNRGTIAKYTTLIEANTMWFLDHERYFCKLVGRSYEIVSFPINDELQALDTVSDAFCESLIIEGKTFILLAFPTENKSWLYDFALDRWYRIGLWDQTNIEYDIFTGRSHCFAADSHLHLIGDAASSGKIFKMSSDYNNDNGTAIRARFVTSHIDHGTDRKKASNYLRFHFKAGVATTAVTAPVFSVRWKDDMGEWGNWINISLGAVGVYNRQYTLRRMGQYYTRQYEVACTDNVDFEMLEIYEDFEVLDV